MSGPKTIDLPHILSQSWSTITTYTPSSIITYNISLLCAPTLDLVYEAHPGFHALPTFSSLPVISIMGHVTSSFPSLLPNFAGHNHVHGEHFTELYHPFPTKGTTTLKTTAKIVDVVEKKGGVTVVVGIWTSNTATGQKICYSEWTSFILKVPGAGASKTTKDRGSATKLYPSPTDRKPDMVVTQQTTETQAALYRAASGDLNPLHIDPDVAKKGGFEGPILTGTCTIGMGVRQIIEVFGEGGRRRFRSVKVRLSKPVFPGEEVRTEMWREEGGRRVVYRQCVGDRVVMRDAAVEFEDVIEGDDRMSGDRESFQRAVGAKL